MLCHRVGKTNGGGGGSVLIRQCAIVGFMNFLGNVVF